MDQSIDHKQDQPLAEHDIAHCLNILGNLTRLQIFKLLVTKKSLKVGDIQEIIKIPGSTLSHHLNKLKAAGLVLQQRSNTTLYCSIDHDKFIKIMNYLYAQCFCLKNEGCHCPCCHK